MQGKVQAGTEKSKPREEINLLFPGRMQELRGQAGLTHLDVHPQEAAGWSSPGHA